MILYQNSVLKNVVTVEGMFLNAMTVAMIIMMDVVVIVKSNQATNAKEGHQLALIAVNVLTQLKYLSQCLDKLDIPPKLF